MSRSIKTGTSTAAKLKNRKIPPMPKLTWSMEFIDNEKAKEYLANSRFNRDQDRRNIERFMRAMISGEWKNGDPICFIGNDLLFQGQHRLVAIVLANEECPGIGFWFQVVRGYDEDDAKVANTGKPASVGDILKHLYGEKYSTRDSTVCRVLGDIILNDYKRDFSVQEVINIKNENTDALSFAIKMRGDRVGIAAVAGAFAYAYPVFPKEIVGAAEQFVNGLFGFKAGNPIKCLHTRITKRKGKCSDHERRMIAEWTLNALHFHVHKKPMKALRDSDSTMAWWNMKRRAMGLDGWSLKPGVTVSAEPLF